MFLSLLSFLLVTSLQGVGGQKIVEFGSFLQNNNSCMEPSVAREYQDRFFIYAILRLEHASAQDWWAFVLQSPKELFNETIAMVRIDECEPGSWPNVDRMPPDTSVCWKNAKGIHAIFAIGVVPQYNQSFFSGVWSKESSGSLRTGAPYIKLRTVAPDDERLEVNGMVHSINDKYIVLPLDAMFSIRYCVRNINKHQLQVAFKVKEKSADDCVVLNSTLKEFRGDEQIMVGLIETEGMCKRYIYRTFVIVKEKKAEEEEKFTFKSFSGANRIVMAPFEHFALVAVMWAVSFVY